MNRRRVVVLSAAWACLGLAGLAAWAAEPTVDTLIGNLKSSDESARLQAIDQLGRRRTGRRSGAPLQGLLTDSSAKVRRRTLSAALGEIGSAAKPAVPALAELVKDSDETVRRQAVKAVMKIHPGPKVTVPLCVKLLEDPDPGVRMRILNAVSEMGCQGRAGTDRSPQE